MSITFIAKWISILPVYYFSLKIVKLNNISLKPVKLLPLLLIFYSIGSLLSINLLITFLYLASFLFGLLVLLNANY